MNPPNPNKQKITAIIGLVVIVAAIGVGLAAASNKKTAASTTTATIASNSTTASTSPTATTSTTSTTAANTSGYADGTYQATGDYDTPGGNESLTVSVTLKSGVITDTSATASNRDRESREYQSEFISGYKSQVVGQSIASLQLSHVSGSSLTPIGFNSALDQIKAKAKS